MLPGGGQPGHQLHHRRACHVRCLMLLTGKWTTKGVHTVEEFDPDPYLEALDQYGLPRSESHSPALVD